MDSDIDESIYSEMWKNKLHWSCRKLSLAFYANFVVVLSNFVSEIYFNGFFSNYKFKCFILVFYSYFYICSSWAKKSPFRSVLFSFIHSEVVSFTLLYYAFFSDTKNGKAYLMNFIVIIMFYQRQLCVGVRSIIIYTIKFDLVLISVSYYSGYIFELLNEKTLTCFVSITMYLGLIIYFDYLQDISLLKAKKEVEISMSKIELIVGALSDGILVINQSLYSVLTNSVMKEITNGESEASYMSDLKYYNYSESTKDHYLIDDISKAFKEDFGYELSLGVTKKNEKLIEWKGRVVKWDSAKCIIIYARDITQVMRLEKESKENKYKSLLLRTVSHELRTPTNSMLLVTEQLKEENQLSTENKDKLDILYCSCSYLLCLINDLLDYSQIMAGSLKISSIQFNLESLILDCFKLIEIQIKNRAIKLDLILNNTPKFIVSDPNRLKQILLNLLGNSVKFTISGTITLKVSSINEILSFSIQDTGVGIPEDKISQLFKQFGKLEDKFYLNPQGTGLGLFISNMLTYKLGGQGVQVESSAGSGSCFKFFISIESGNENLFVTNNDCVKIEMTRERIIESKVLIVDDSPFNILAIQQILEKEGFKTEFSTNGQDAINKIRSLKFDLVLMDCEMPVLDGWETTKKLKCMEKEGELARVPFIIGHTSHNYDQIKEKCLEMGMDDVILKPCPRIDLINTVKKWIN